MGSSLLLDFCMLLPFFFLLAYFSLILCRSPLSVWLLLPFLDSLRWEEVLIDSAPQPVPRWLHAVALYQTETSPPPSSSSSSSSSSSTATTTTLMYLFGGVTAGNVPLNDLWAFDFSMTRDEGQEAAARTRAKGRE